MMIKLPAFSHRFLLSGLVLSLLAISASGQQTADPAVGTLGIDVSHHSGDVDWKKVESQGYRFAYLKASEGVDDPDPRFEEHWRALEGSGIRRGAYHFYVTEDDPDDQARLFLSQVVGLEPGDLPPVVDIESLGHGTGPGLATRLQRFLDRVEAELGTIPIIYTSPRFWNEHLAPSFARYPLWVAEYEVDQPTVPKGWSDWHFWQFQGDAAIDGVEKQADLSRLHPEIDLDSLRVGTVAAGSNGR